MANGYDAGLGTSDMVFSDIPVEDTTSIPVSGVLQDSSYGGPSGGGIGPTGWIDPTLDSTGDEGYVDSAGALGGGNSTSSNDANASTPAQGSPLGSFASIIQNLEGIAIGGAAIANAVEGRTGSTTIGRRGQSAPVRGSRPSVLDRLFGPSTTSTKTGTTSVIAMAVIVTLIVGLGFLVYRGIR
jgi:hypothetical protein